MSAGPRRCVAVVGPGENASEDAVRDAETVGRLVAEHGWVVLCGGRAAGVMAAAARGAAAAGGIAIGLLPGSDAREAAPALTIALPTGLGEARNAVLVTAADAVIACGMNPGTASEVALALRARKPVALVSAADPTARFFRELGGDALLHVASSPEEAVRWVANMVGGVAESG